MRSSSIKQHLAPYSIVSKRRTTINHAFASALAPVDSFDAERIGDALRALGQDPAGDLTCVYCDRPGETWDHLVGLVKNSELCGYGHQLGNLVPCCRNCNSKKGNRDWRSFVREHYGDSAETNRRIMLISHHLESYAVEVDLAALSKDDEDVRQFNEVKARILDLMRQADGIAVRLRQKIGRGQG